MRNQTQRKIEKLRRDIKYSVQQIELWKARIDTEERKIQSKASEIIKLENDNS